MIFKDYYKILNLEVEFDNTLYASFISLKRSSANLSFIFMSG